MKTSMVLDLMCQRLVESRARAREAESRAHSDYWRGHADGFATAAWCAVRGALLFATAEERRMAGRLIRERLAERRAKKFARELLEAMNPERRVA